MDYESLIADLQKISQMNSISHYKRDVCAAAAAALSTLQAKNEKLRAELESVRAERNAAEALLAERSGVTGSAPITTAFGIPLERLRELAQADREGRVRIAGRPPLEDECCGNCGHFRRIAGTRRGDCSVHGYIKNRLGQEDRSRGRFTPFQSRKACRQFQRRTDDDGRSDPEG